MGSKADKNACDLLASAIVRSLGYCQRCEQHLPFKQLQTSHYLSRKYTWTRTHLPNLVCLCASCHRIVEDNRPLHSRFFIELRGEETEETVYRLYHTHAEVRQKFDWAAVRERLEKICRQTVATGQHTVDGITVRISSDAEMALRARVRK